MDKPVSAPTARAARAVVLDKFKPKETAGSSKWRQLIANKQEIPKAILANAITAFRLAPEWQSVLSYDTFALATQVRHAPPWEGTGPTERAWSPLDDVLAANWLQHNGITVGLDTTQMAVEAVAQDACYHPIRDYLNGLNWDGEARIATWLSTYLGVERSPYSEAVGARFLIGAVARVMKPGCKADCMLVIEGPQGAGKSQAMQRLCGQWFSDELSELGSKDASLQLSGAWIFELSELDAMQRADIAKVKAFLSRTTDRFRPPYGRRVIEAPRQCVFVGTTNSDNYLRDETGARRFWPVKATTISLDAIECDRDQLWAEATKLFRAGRPWWIDDPSIAVAAKDAQDERYLGDPWDDEIRHFAKGLPYVTVEQILADLLHVEKSKWTQPDKNRIARSLKAMQFERYQARTGDKRQWRYRKTGDTGDNWDQEADGDLLSPIGDR
jgi:predicted P-loop ATPase